MRFSFFKFMKEKPAPPPEWVECIHCSLEIPFEDAEKVDTGYSHRRQSCQEPFYREREIGQIKKPRLARLPIW